MKPYPTQIRISSSHDWIAHLLALLCLALLFGQGCSEEATETTPPLPDIVFPDSGPPIVGETTGGDGEDDDPNQCASGCASGQICALCIAQGTVQCVTPQAGQAGAACVNNAECKSGYCQVVSGSTINRCAELCDLSEPGFCVRAGEHCKLGEDVEGRQVALCSLSSCNEDGAICSGPDACQCADDFQCIDSGAGYNVCRKSCPNGECPTGYVCEEGICGAIGLKPAGGVCGLNEECDSGECAVFGTLAVCLGRCGDCGICAGLTSGCDRIFTRCNDAGVCAVPDIDEPGGSCLATSVCRGFETGPDDGGTGGAAAGQRAGDGERIPRRPVIPLQEAEGIDADDETDTQDGTDPTDGTDSNDATDDAGAQDGADSGASTDGNTETDSVDTLDGELSCITAPMGSFCSEGCIAQSDCASWQLCQEGTSLEGVQGLFCVPIENRGLGSCCSLQNRCTSDTSECVLDGSELRCAAQCVLDEECPPDYVCSNVQTVVGTTGKYCVLEPPQLQLDICNGVDDDLDGLTDTDVFGKALTRPCYQGPGGTLGIGICAAGVQECESGTWSVCKGQKRPVPDGPTTPTGCDGADNDCDGAVDEGCDCQADPKPCGIDLGECSLGLQLCLDGSWSHCEFGQDILPKWPRPELCDGLDNDCDGFTDNAPADTDYTMSISCGTLPPELHGIGVCVAGQQACGGECSGEVLPTEEACGDALDNDCDGATDEGCECNAMAEVSCGAVAGICEAGLQNCVDDIWSDCIGGTVASTETCDAVDNDCDGIKDNVLSTNVPLSRPCWNLANDPNHLKVGLGQCGPGAQPCLGGDWSTCVGSKLPAPSEVCNNGVDDDCDGSTDEGCVCAGESSPCGVSTGGCSKGAQACIDGVRDECKNTVLPTPEVCNGVDDNCDGFIDNTPTGDILTVTCYPGPPATLGFGICSMGTRSCVDGAFGACVGATTPGDEICNGLDDDCDGLTDEDLDCGCSTEVTCGSSNGQCELGTQSCTGGVLAGVCIGAVYPSWETCNGLDDDCDGSVDTDAEGNLLTESCYSGPPLTRGLGVCVAGTRKCSDGGSWTSCFGEVIPSVDICGDGIDQDCDGVADEGCSCTADDSRPCGTDDGLCNAGSQYCDSGAWSSICSGAVMPALDACNGQDDDCDGVVDNDSGAVALPASSPCYDGILSELDAPVTTCTEGVRYCWNGIEDSQKCIGQVVPVFDKCGDQLNTDCDSEFEEECL